MIMKNSNPKGNPPTRNPSVDPRTDFFSVQFDALHALYNLNIDSFIAWNSNPNNNTKKNRMIPKVRPMDVLDKCKFLLPKNDVNYEAPKKKGVVATTTAATNNPNNNNNNNNANSNKKDDIPDYEKKIKGMNDFQ